MMIQTISPGDRGHFKPIDPFDQLYDFSKVWTCSSVREIKEMVTSGDDPFNTIYKPAGLTDTEFFRDINAGVLIYVFRSDSEEWIQIPSSYINEVPNTVGVEYRNYSIVVSLAGLPVTEDLQSLVDDMGVLAEDTLGIKPAVSLVPSSDVFNVPYEEHDRYAAAREAKITNRKSYKLLYKEAQERLTALATQVSLLECYIAKQDCNIVNRPADADNFVFLDFNWVSRGKQSSAEKLWLEAMN